MRTYLKAIVGALLAGLGALQLALPDGVTQAEWVAVAIATLATGGGVLGVPNAPKPPAADLSELPQDDPA